MTRCGRPKRLWTHPNTLSSRPATNLCAPGPLSSRKRRRPPMVARRVLGHGGAPRGRSATQVSGPPAPVASPGPGAGGSYRSRSATSLSSQNPASGRERRPPSA